MPGELQLSASLIVARDKINLKQDGNARSDQTAAGAWVSTQTIGVTEQDLVLTGVASARVIHMVNDDQTNYIDWGPKLSGVMVPLGQIFPNEPALVSLYPGVVIRMKAHTAPCKISIFVAEA